MGINLPVFGTLFDRGGVQLRGTDWQPARKTLAKQLQRATGSWASHPIATPLGCDSSDSLTMSERLLSSVS